ncbi:protein enabled homolog [Schistocerca cancellata]|uniref:protein enabled homolog n=1 Tax=Schistocerca cancellata TaxID=274614 RepID=UPI0021186246|nr:protein enabled homolog [Schistocerca cancellata]
MALFYACGQRQAALCVGANRTHPRHAEAATWPPPPPPPPRPLGTHPSVRRPAAADDDKCAALRGPLPAGPALTTCTNHPPCAPPPAPSWPPAPLARYFEIRRVAQRGPGDAHRRASPPTPPPLPKLIGCPAVASSSGAARHSNYSKGRTRADGSRQQSVSGARRPSIRRRRGQPAERRRGSGSQAPLTSAARRLPRGRYGPPPHSLLGSICRRGVLAGLNERQRSGGARPEQGTRQAPGARQPGECIGSRSARSRPHPRPTRGGGRQLHAFYLRPAAAAAAAAASDRLDAPQREQQLGTAAGTGRRQQFAKETLSGNERGKRTPPTRDGNFSRP